MIPVHPWHYIHVQDNNSNTKRVVTGPHIFTLKDHEEVILDSTPMVVIPPYSYCVIINPYIRVDENSREPKLKDGEAVLRYGEEEIRFWDEWTQPFPLLPGEIWKDNRAVMVEVVSADSALKLVATRDFEEENEEAKEPTKRTAGDEWLFYGPNVYRPRVEVKINARVQASVIPPDHALKLKAIKSFADRNGQMRKAGEEWLIRTAGTYLPSVYEEKKGLLKPYTLTSRLALHLKAKNMFKDVYGVQRKAGEEWLVTKEDSELHIQDIYETVIGLVHLKTLRKNQWCFVEDPFVEGKNLLGTKQLREGVTSFFLYPGERMPNGIEDTRILRDNEALLLRAQENFYDDKQDCKRSAGDQWMITGPCAYVPRVEVQILKDRKEVALAANEGRYVRNTKTGEVRAVIGGLYMLQAEEEPWLKELPKEVEEQVLHALKKQSRVKTHLVTFPVSYNAAVQIYDYKREKPRVVFGPAMVILQPEEEITVLSLSGDTPKRPHLITCLELRLGPDFMTDIVEVETSDHARLKVTLSYNWRFKVDQRNPHKIFQVKDFVGDACKALASRVRGAVAASSFDHFHRHSARIIRRAVFGETDEGKIKDNLTFTSNSLLITNVDIQSVEPIDERTRESLQKSVQLAIEITTREQKRNAKFDADSKEQEAKSELTCQKIINQRAIEQAKQKLIEKQCSCKAIEAAGEAEAEAKGRKKKLLIEADLSVKQATLAVEASEIEAKASLIEAKQTKDVEIAHNEKLLEMELKKASALSDIETEKFSSLVNIIGSKTIQSIARAGPEMQARLLKGLGLKGYLMTDGNSPINLFNAAKGMVAGPAGM